MNKQAFDDFAQQAEVVIKELLDYAQLPGKDRTEENEGQVRRLRGITGGLTAALEAARHAGPMMITPPAPPAAPAAPPPPAGDERRG
jgi:hypothetical protein